MCRSLDEQVEALRGRPLDGDSPYVWPDAKHVKVRSPWSRPRSGRSSQAEGRPVARERVSELIGRLGQAAPKVAAMLEEAEEDLIAFDRTAPASLARRLPPVRFSTVARPARTGPRPGDASEGRPALGRGRLSAGARRQRSVRVTGASKTCAGRGGVRHPEGGSIREVGCEDVPARSPPHRDGVRSSHGLV